jgi:hypothetical protein
MLPRFSDAARVLQSMNVGCRFLDDTEAIKLQLPNNRRLPTPGAPVRMNLFMRSHYGDGG